MGKKVFSGLGSLNAPFSVTRSDTTAVAGNSVIKSTVSLSGAFRSTNLASISISPDINFPSDYSGESVHASFSTLFHDFSLSAESVYNFFVDDELVNDSSFSDENKLSEIPRYIRLLWTSPPVQKSAVSTTKAVRSVSFGIKRNPAVLINGEFVKSLAAVSIPSIKTSVANASLFPGVMRTALEFQTKGKDVSAASEEQFLFSNETGISIHETPSNKRTSTETSIVRANFVDTSVAEALSEERITSIVKPEHAENIAAIARLSSELHVLSDVRSSLAVDRIIKSYPSSIDSSTVEYVGYVLEKYVRNDRGSFDFLEEIDIDDISVTEYIDRKVLYGKEYRYRIKCLVRWTRDSSVGVEGIRKEESKNSTGSSKQSSYFETEWSAPWATTLLIDKIPPDPPDEIQVIPESSKKRITLTWKCPYDPQRDISQIEIFRRKRLKMADFIEPWKRIAVFPFANGIFFDTDVDFIEDNGGIEYVYSFRSVSRHKEFSFLSVQLAASLTEFFSTLGENDVEFVSCQGVDINAFGSLSTSPPTIFKEDSVAKTTAVFTGRNGPAVSTYDDVNYVVRIECLDTGERSDIKLLLDYQDYPNRVSENAIIQKPPIKSSVPNVILQNDITIANRIIVRR